MKPKCPKQFSSQSSSPQSAGLDPSHSNLNRVVRDGRYYRRSDSRWIEKFHCRACGTHFSRATLSESYRQKKRRVNAPLEGLLCSGVSQRRASRLLRINRKTVARKLKWLAVRARKEQREFLRTYHASPLEYVQFDDLETSEHTKCKPLSVALAVEPKNRKILSIHVSQMPAKGPLARIAIKKYGYRRDERSRGWRLMMEDLAPLVNTRKARFLSDENPHYPRFVKKYFPAAEHQTVKGRRGCVAGQGELKKIGFDPLFSLNHTCAMLRAHINRLFRRTWCTTKKRESLRDHLALYVSYHNRLLTPASAA